MQAGPPEHPFVGSGPYRPPCGAAPPLACNGGMQTERGLLAATLQLVPDAIKVAGLGKRYGQVQAVRDVSFTVRTGEIVALLGPNGAGKTTTLEILEGFRARDGGVAEVLGLDPGDHSSARELRERPGLVLQDIAVEPYMKVRETIARSAGY